MVEKILKQQTGFLFVKEHRFHKIRKWRFDFANIETKTAVEVEGAVYANGRHTRGVGYVNDMEKYNSAIELSWAVLRYSTSQMNEAKTYDQIKRVVETRYNIIYNHSK